MKVLMTADPIGGVWRYVVELAGGLASADVDVVVATLGARPSPSQREELGQLPRVVLHESDFRLEWMANPWADLEAAGDWLLGVAQEAQPDVVHLNHLLHAGLPFGAPVMTVVHSCVLSWWEAVHGERAPDSWQRYRIEVRKSVGSAQLLVTATRAMRDAVRRHYEPAAPLRVIPNASRRAEQLHREGGEMPPRERLVLSAGRAWDAAKNIPLLDAAAATIAWPVMVAGAVRSPDGDGQPLRSATSLGVLPFEELQRLCARAAIYAHPARYEPFGLSVLEAAHAGCALVLGDIPSLRENWDGAAVFVSTDDSTELAATINALATDDTKRDAMGRAARLRAQQFRHDRMVDQYLELYAGLTHSSGRVHEQVGA